MNGVVDVLSQAKANGEREEDHVELLEPACHFFEGLLGGRARGGRGEPPLSLSVRVDGVCREQLTLKSGMNTTVKRHMYSQLKT